MRDDGVADISFASLNEVENHEDQVQIINFYDAQETASINPMHQSILYRRRDADAKELIHWHD